MKKIALYIGSSAILAFAISSCSKSALDQPGFPGLRCGVGSTEYIADSAFYTKDQGSNRGTVIKAYTRGAERFEFNIYQADTNGTFAIDTNSRNPNIAYYWDENAVKYKSTKGSVIITKYFNDSLAKVTGTFNFEGLAPNGSTISISYGYFNNVPRR